MAIKPFAESCMRNQEAITEVLSGYWGEGAPDVLELGSGTGQHAVFVGQVLTNLRWQPSDLEDCLEGIRAWIEDSACENVLSPLRLDVSAATLSLTQNYDGVFSANTLHFVSEENAQAFIRCASLALKPGGKLIVYGPFNDAGRYSSEGNARLDVWLRERDPASGIKDLQWVQSKAGENGMEFLTWHQMPANNLCLVFRRHNPS